MSEGRVRLVPGTLWRSIVRRTERAIRRGALRPIETDSHLVEQGGVRFVVRIVSNLVRKDEARAEGTGQDRALERPVNPFLPYEEDLFVADISDTHLCLLNKYNVFDHHALIVTRHFEHQEAPLTRADFEALWACMAEFEGLGFYNTGKTAGASQPHKHLQILPLPIASDGPPVPIEALFDQARSGRTIDAVPGLRFRHALAWLDPALVSRPLTAAAIAHERYHRMLDTVGIDAVDVGAGISRLSACNLLIARGWMLLVPRSREFFETISVNALGFAGSFFVRDEQQREIVVRCGPMTVLEGVSCPNKA